MKGPGSVTINEQLAIWALNKMGPGTFLDVSIVTGLTRSQTSMILRNNTHGWVEQARHKREVVSAAGYKRQVAVFYCPVLLAHSIERFRISRERKIVRAVMQRIRAVKKVQSK